MAPTIEKADARNSIDFDFNDALLEDGSVLESAQRSRCFRLIQLVFNVIVVMYILVTLPILVNKSVCSIPQPYSPANEVISYELHPLLFHEYDPSFYGTPEETDAHWEKLLEPSVIRASMKDLQTAHAEFTSDMVELADGENPAVLAVYHELHCLDGMRKNMHREYYFPNLTVEEEAFNNFHQRHCIESLRRTLMCKADASFYASYWMAPEGSSPSKELRSHSGQVCANWEMIDQWARGRMLEKNKFLVKPGPFD